MPQAVRRKERQSPREIEDRIRGFLAKCLQPVLVEPGEAPIPLTFDRYSIEPRGETCVLHAWGESGNLVRRVTAVTDETRGKLALRVRRFGGKDATVALVDSARKSSLQRSAGPAQFRETLRRMLAREFSEWTIEQLIASPDLEHSLSGLYARGVMRRGQQAWALIGASAEAGSAVCDQILSFGLIWVDQVWRRERSGTLAGLRIFLKHGHTRATANRLAFLRKDALRYCLHEFDAQSHLASLDERDFGNLHTELLSCRPAAEPVEPVAAWVGQLRQVAGVEAVAGTDGLISLRVRGLRFARAGTGVVTFGIESQRPVTATSLPEALTLARELARFRSAGALDRLNPLYRKYPESWLESQVRRDVRVVDPTLLPEPVYTHPVSIAGADRGIIDLLACDIQGRLVVIELKATEDIHLPVQGLDYWMRVKWHLDHGDFQSRGYFPGIALSPQPPRLLLVSPAVEFHPTTETVLRYLPPELEVERVGVSEDWRHDLRVVFRKRGAGRLA